MKQMDECRGDHLVQCDEEYRDRSEQANAGLPLRIRSLAWNDELHGIDPLGWSSMRTPSFIASIFAR
jgi:hypothetical protein